jgi:hypothetical protein
VIATHAVDRNFDCHCYGKRQNRNIRNPRWNMTVCKTKLQPMKKEKAMLHKSAPPVSVSSKSDRLLVVFGFQDFTTTVEAVRADVVTQVGFTGGWLDAQLWSNQEIVRTVHTALRWGLLVLLNCHVNDS